MKFLSRLIKLFPFRCCYCYQNNHTNLVDTENENWLSFDSETYYDALEKVYDEKNQQYDSFYSTISMVELDSE